MKIIIRCLLFVLLVSCTKTSEEAVINTTEDPFVHEIEETFPEVKNISESDFDSGFTYFPHRIAVDANGRLVVVEGRTWRVYLADETGSLLAEAGGRGRGPGEFLVVNDLYISEDNRLYILDRTLMRITLFDIEEHDLVYRQTINLDLTTDLQLQEIFAWQQQWFGVFRPSKDRRTGEQRVLLYKLDENFHPEEHLLDMPGVEQMQLDSGAFTDHVLGVTTHWDVQNEWFYFARSDRFTVEKLNLLTRERKSVSFLESATRPHHAFAKAFFEERMGDNVFLMYPKIREKMNEQETLPLFSDLAVHDGKIWFTLFYTGTENGHAIIADPASGEVSWVALPPALDQLTVYGNTLYAIDYVDPAYQEPRIMAFSIKE